MLSADNVVAQTKKYSPHVAAWWVVLIQGLVVGALGIYLVGDTAGARENGGKLIALYLYSVGLSDLARHRFLPDAPGKGVAYIRALVAAIVGGLCVVLLIFPFTFTASLLQWVRWALGAGMLIYGVAGLYLAFTVRERGSGRLLSTIAAAIFILLGVSVLFLHDANVLGAWIGPVLIVLGLGLIGFSIYRFRQTRQASADAEAAAATAAAAAVVTTTDAPALVSTTTDAAPVAAASATATPVVSAPVASAPAPDAVAPVVPAASADTPSAPSTGESGQSGA